MLQTYTWSTGDYAYQSWSNGYKIHLKLTEEYITGKASVISYEFSISNTNNNRFYQNGYSWNISIGGQTIPITNFNFYVYPYNVTQVIKSGQITVEHNSDGTLNMPFDVSIPNVKADNRYAPPDMRIASTWALTPIQTAPPIVTASVVDTNPVTLALTGNSSKLIKYFSTAYATVSAVGQNGAVIDQDLYTIKNGSTTEYGTSHSFENVESNVFTFSAQDNRGNIGTATVTPTMVNYVKLTCNMETTRPDASGNMDLRCTGTFYNRNFGAVRNTLEVNCRYRVKGGAYGDWIPMTIVENDDYFGDTDYYGAYATFKIPDFNDTIDEYDYQAIYEFECQATDKLATVTATPISSKSIPVFHWGENDFAFEVPVNCVDDLNVKGDLRLKGDGNYGNTLRFGDGDWCYISEPSDDEMTIQANHINIGASTINLNAEAVNVNGNRIPTLQYGLWEPVLSPSFGVSYYTENCGWYSRVGNVVSIGFYIKATCTDSYNSFTITGLPFTPLFRVAGGGMCSGARVSGGFTFQCFVAEEDGTITTRVQACNNTSTANLSTSASGCYYPLGGGELTLSGTITYIAVT